jgi:prepilin-type N-terminal cleavage/methylation domain-containing protein
MRLLQRRGRNNSAFTIVELIVVIAVIGILAGIVIVGYSGWRAATTATQVKNDLNTAAQAMESARTFNNAYPTTLPSITTSSTHITLTLASGSTAAAYCIDGVSSDSPSNPYYVAFESKDQGPLAGTCATRTNVPVPAVPASLAVTSSNDTSISMSWGATTYAATYTLQCATDLGFVNGVVSTSQSGLTGTVSSLSPSTIYYCHINAVDGAGASAWSTSVSTTTKNPPFSTIVAGTGTTYAIRTDGSLWAWGRNDYGQVGNNSNASQLTPIKVISSGVSQVVASNYYMAYAIKTDGSLWAWGRNYNGAIGNNSTTDQLTPLKIISSGVSKVVSLSFTTYIIKTDGSLWAWGRGDYAQIGNGATVDQLTPVQIISSGVSQVVAGSYAAYAVKTIKATDQLVIIAQRFRRPLSKLLVVVSVRYSVGIPTRLMFLNLMVQSGVGALTHMVRLVITLRLLN